MIANEGVGGRGRGRGVIFKSDRKGHLNSVLLNQEPYSENVPKQIHMQK